MYHDGEFSSEHTKFIEFPNKQRNKYIKLMLEDIELNYRKWKFALLKEKRHDFRDRDPVGGKEGDVTRTSRKFKVQNLDIYLYYFINDTSFFHCNFV